MVVFMINNSCFIIKHKWFEGEVEQTGSGQRRGEGMFFFYKDFMEHRSRDQHFKWKRPAGRNAVRSGDMACASDMIRCGATVRFYIIYQSNVIFRFL